MKAWQKWLGSGLLLLVLLFGGIGWWLHGNLDAIVKRAIGHYGSQMTQARVSVDEVQIRSTDGAGVIRGLVVGNPAGFRTPHALKVGIIDVAVDIRTLADPVVVIKRIVIESPDVIYEKGDTMTNFDAIQRNIARSLGPASGGGSAGSSPGRKLIVEELTIRHARAQASTAALGGNTMSATLPDITLRNVGRAQGGVTPGQLGEIVARALSQRLVASLSFDRAIKSLGDRVKGLFGK
ncbi:hypothetical protein [Piscinibacter sp. XHJ-5]|uniref:hypothetical protein n=1 Tax=Piscinibacter sp. XHJ-5 TaxID=3037797 RepID=UPI0024533D22|nr:hypothetical protein [Piscinibacter sp. XHJ-5]